MERTFVLLKPDAVQRGLAGEILARFERRGYRILALKMLQADRDLAEGHYEVHRGKFFFDGLVQHLTSGPVVAMVLEGDNVIQAVRTMVGSTIPNEAAAGTIRGDLAPASPAFAIWFTRPTRPKAPNMRCRFISKTRRSQSTSGTWTAGCSSPDSPAVSQYVLGTTMIEV